MLSLQKWLQKLLTQSAQVVTFIDLCLVLWPLCAPVHVLGLIDQSVSLTVEGGVSLVGPHCPGTARLVCEGVSLTVLRWRYNGANDIHIFDALDSQTSIVLSDHPAFLSASLTEVSPLPTDPRFANFTSTLTVDLEQLQSVMDIVCGDPVTAESIVVDIMILQPSAPKTPNITNVFASYQSTMLSSVEVSWEKLRPICPEFNEASLVYQLSVGSAMKQTNSQASCGQTLCTAVVNITGRGPTEISLTAINDIGSSGIDTYPMIEQMIGWYFTPQVHVNTDSCSATAQCVPGDGLSESTTCSVQFTSDPTYMNLSDPVTGPLDTILQLPTSVQPNTAYYFVFTAMDATLVVRIHLEQTSNCNLREVETSADTVFVLLLLLPLIVVFATTFIVTLWIVRRHSHRSYNPRTGLSYECDRCENHRTSPMAFFK